MSKAPEAGSGSPEKEPRTLDDIEKSILLHKQDGLPDSKVIQGLESPPSGRKGFSQEEIERAFQRLRDYGFLDKDGLITEDGIDYLASADI